MGNVFIKCCENITFYNSLFGKKRKKYKNSTSIATPLYYQYPIPLTVLITDMSGQITNNQTIINQSPLNNDYI
jgi:hypothetical protein